MAKLSSDGKYVTVEKGDTLWAIASTYLGAGNKYKQLATINKLSNPDLIYVGQKIYLTSNGSSGSSSANSNVITIKQFGLLATSDNTLFATWDWSKDNTESYKVLWTYDLGNGIELQGANTTITIDTDAPAMARQSTFNIPDGARKIYFKVKPIAKTKSSKDGKETKYWTIGWSAKKTYTNTTPLATPGAPAIKIEDLTLTATLSDIDITGANSIVFEVIENNSKTHAVSKAVSIVTGYASYSCKVNAGCEYKVRCYAYNTSKKEKSEWSPYSSSDTSQPSPPTGITTIKATSTTSVYLEWSEVAVAKTYDIEYATKEEYFDNTDQTTTKSGIEVNHFEFINLESGTHYFFRVRAVNENSDISDWSPIADVIIGKSPAAPTTWSSTTTAIVGKPVTLYWVHNSKDGSSQTYAELEFTIDGVLQLPTTTIKNTEDEDEKDKTSSYQIDTSEFVEGTHIEWRVRTAGIALDTQDGGYGDWSTMREINVYAEPTLTITVVDSNDVVINELNDSPLTSFPFILDAIAGPKTQTPIGYHVAITSNQIYETVDAIGNPRTVNKDEALYSKYFDISGDLAVEFTPGNLDLENSMSYTLTCTVSMDSGLTAEESISFTVAWTETIYEPNAEIGVDEDTLTATIRPYCSNSQIVRYKVERSGYSYVKTNEALGYVYGTVVRNATTTTGETVYLGTSAVDEEVYYCEVIETTAITDVWLSVYRREYDGTFTELGTGLDAALNVAITDPHPALDYARYRIVAASKTTGAISYYDLPGHPVGGSAVVIQWNEDWTSFDATVDAALEQPPWAGSLLKLPYNIDVSESTAPDVSFVEYAGREHPVSYYGTQVGETATWNVSVPKEDKETVYALRRLSKWMDNVYVREPSGVGYWANINVSFSQKHCEVVIPVSLTIKRVEGGI